MTTFKNNIRIYMLFLFTIIGTTVNAQQDAQYTQYMYNSINVNPAYAGSRDVLSIFGLFRTQWVGLDGAPQTGTLSMHTPVGERVGLGVSVVNDRIGPSDETNLAVDFSYNIPLAGSYRLFFGVKGSGNFLNIDYTKLSIYNPMDLGYQNNVDNKFSPNVGAGFYLHSDKTYVGLSAPYFLETKHYNHQTTTSAKEKMHYYVTGGHVFDLSNSIQFKPSAIAKVVPGAPLQLDLSANFLFNEKLTLGASYRWDAAFSGMVGFQITPGLLAGYAYDLDTTKLGNYNSGSHEIFLRFEVFKNNEPVVNPRFF